MRVVRTHTHSYSLSECVSVRVSVCIGVAVGVRIFVCVCVSLYVCLCVCERGRMNHSTTCINKEMQTLLLYFANPLTRALDIKWF